MNPDLDAPVKYFGGKRRIAAYTWRRFGKPRVYIEPFCGMSSVLLRRKKDSVPEGTIRETINDRDAFVANFLRSIKLAPEFVLENATEPPSEIEIRARWKAVASHRGRLRHELLHPEWCDPVFGGWFLYLYSNAIRPCTGSDAPKSAKPSLHQDGILSKVQRSEALTRLKELRDRLQDVRICCGDYRNVMTDAELDAESVAIFVDPPYKKAAGMYDKGGGKGSITVKLDYDELVDRCIQLGENKKNRIALAGYKGDYKLPKSWYEFLWDETPGGKETLWMSPACTHPRVSPDWAVSKNPRPDGIESVMSIMTK
jgi:site-specific DNA-adenine methylase